MGENFSDVSNDDLDEYVREILEVTPSAGQRLVEGGLRKRGFRIQCHLIQESIRRVDTVLRTLRAAQQIIRSEKCAMPPMRYGKINEFFEALFS